MSDVPAYDDPWAGVETTYDDQLDTDTDAGPGLDPSPDRGRRSGSDPGAEPVEPRYPTMDVWWHQWFRPVVERQMTSSLVWCPKWWSHNEALAILSALWTSWEAARIADDADAMLTWWERATGMLNHLTSRDFGPFAACTSKEHRDNDLRLPHVDPPAGFFGLVLDPTDTSAQA